MEWCQDGFDEGFYRRSSGAKDPVRDSSGALGRIARGGSFWRPKHTARACHRDYYSEMVRSDDIGFRVARDAR